MRCNSVVGSSALLIAVAGLGASSASAFVPWSNASGTADFFRWENGGSTNGLFGDPILVGGDTFVFHPDHFRAESINGGTSTTSDTLSVDLIVNTGRRFSGIRISEAGDYGVLTNGSVSASSVLSVEDLNRGRSASTLLLMDPAFPVDSGVGSWSGLGSLDLESLPPNWRRIRVTLSNELIAISEPGSITYIQKTVVGDAVAVTIVPAPGAAAVIGLAGLATARRRR